jgi:cytidine deaminase
MTREMDESILEALVQEALKVRLRAHAPYSRFQVGAALLTDNGKTIVGCNVENASFSLTICAERVAAGTAIAGGDIGWTAIAVASLGGVTPCGACRQFLAEFNRDLLVLSVDAETQAVRRYQLSDLLPFAFDKDALP